MKKIRAISRDDAERTSTAKDNTEGNVQTDGEPHRSKTERMAGKSVTRRGDPPLEPKDGQAFDPALKNLNEVFPDTHSTWRNMKARARKQKLKIDPEFETFRNFLWHMGSRRHPDLTLDRIDPSRPEYGPGLCRWADKPTQSNNRRNTKKILYKGDYLPLTEVAHRTGTPAGTLRSRARRNYSADEIINGKSNKRRRHPGNAARGPNWWPSCGSSREWWEENYSRALRGEGRLKLTDDAKRTSAHFVMQLAEYQLIHCYPERVEQYRLDFNDQDFVNDRDRFDELSRKDQMKVKLVEQAFACINEAHRHDWETEGQFRPIAKSSPPFGQPVDPERRYDPDNLTPEKAYQVYRSYEKNAEEAPNEIIEVARPIINAQRKKNSEGIRRVLPNRRKRSSD